MVSAVFVRPLWWTRLRALRRLTGVAAAAVALAGGIGAGPVGPAPLPARPASLAIVLSPAVASSTPAANRPRGGPAMASAPLAVTAVHRAPRATPAAPATATELHRAALPGSASGSVVRQCHPTPDHRCGSALGGRAPPTR